MRMKFRLLLLLLLPVFAGAQDKMTLTGKIKGIPDGTKVSLIDVNRPGDTVTAAIVKKGTFVLKAELKEAMLVNLILPNSKSVMSFLDNSSVSVSGNITEAEKLKITGSATSKSFLEFQKTFNPLFDRLVKYNQQMQQQGRTEELAASSVKLQDSIQLAIDAYIKKYHASPVSAFLLAATMQLKDDILLAESRVNALKPVALTNMYGAYLNQTISEGKITAIGTTVSDFTQPDTSGNPVSMSSFRGKYVLVDFWASWCGPCRQENPNVVSNFNKFKEKNFTVLGVSLDRPGQKERWLQAIYTDQLAWTHVSDLQFWNNAVAQQFRIQSIPQNLLIGPDGKIVAKNLRGPDLEAKLCEILGCEGAKKAF